MGFRLLSLLTLWLTMLLSQTMDGAVSTINRRQEKKSEEMAHVASTKKDTVTPRT